MAATEYTVFEYLYRDAANFKAWGSILLEGVMSPEDERSLRECFVDGIFFDAEKLGVPSLRKELWLESGSGYTDELDHGWHEFSEVRVASHEELQLHRLWGDVGEFVRNASLRS
jgi:hypothetical protein